MSWRARASSLVALALLAGASACGTSEPAGTAAPTAVTDPATTPDQLHALRVVTRVQRPQRAHFALLRTAPEGLPPATQRLLRTPLVGMSWRLAQRIPVALAAAYWLVPADGHLCVVSQGSLGSPGASTTCARTDQALDHGVADITVARAHPGAPRPARLIVGVAPDGAREAIVHTGGAVERAPVVDGIFVLRDARPTAPDVLDLR